MNRARARIGFRQLVRLSIGLTVLAVWTVLRSPVSAAAVEPEWPSFDFTVPSVAAEWGQPHDIRSLQPTSDGLVVSISGGDPYFFGPSRDYPTNSAAWIILKIKADQAGPVEIFYFQNGSGPRAGQSVSAQVPAGRWVELRIPMPTLGRGTRLRLDPPGAGGTVTIGSLRTEKRSIWPEPVWPAWRSPAPLPDVVRETLVAGPLELRVATNQPFGFELLVAGQSMAFGHPRPRFAYQHDGEVSWVDWVPSRVWKDDRGALVLEATARDGENGTWQWHQRIQAESPGVLRLDATIQVDRDRDVLFLPWQLLVAGEGSFGRHKHQGLLAGLEYLEDEPSRSEADIIGPEANRRVPASVKLTLPFMAIQAAERYLGLLWSPSPDNSALFDSPDRTFGSGGHLMGVLAPGSDGENRVEGNLLPYRGWRVQAGREIRWSGRIIGGIGSNLIPAIQQAVVLHGWPEHPGPGLSLSNYVELASRGWLTSRVREANRYRHAFWSGFNAQPAADAAAYEWWLADRTSDATRAGQLRDAARGALSLVSPPQYLGSGVGHVRPPMVPLVFGGVLDAVRSARDAGRSLVARFGTNDSIFYTAAARGPDYARTHYAREANGLTAPVVAALLEAAAFSGDRELREAGLARLRALDKYRGGVPRGAQTWEVPLHTPDILAAAHLVRAYTLGYELTGDVHWREQAVEWAWTGVPFVYLTDPTSQPIGRYATIAVLGATGWRAPVWFGRPVQWCGIVYADALYRLAEVEPAGPWRSLADGITATGLQVSWKVDDAERVGLLPDFFELAAQSRAGPAINPGTVQNCAVRLFGGVPLYDFRAARSNGLLVHVAGAIESLRETSGRLSFDVRGWTKESHAVLVTGCHSAWAAQVNGAPATASFDESLGALVIEVQGTNRMRLELSDPSGAKPK